MKHLVMLFSLLCMFQQIYTSAYGDKAPKLGSKVVKVLRVDDGSVSWMFSQEDVRPQDALVRFSTCFIVHDEGAAAKTVAKHLLVKGLNFHAEWKKDVEKEIASTFPTLIALVDITRDLRGFQPRSTFFYYDCRGGSPQVGDIGLCGSQFPKPNLVCVSGASEPEGERAHEFSAQPDIAALLREGNVVAVHGKWLKYVRSSPERIGFEINSEPVEEVWKREVSSDEK